jgi:hypothetical protein
VRPTSLLYNGHRGQSSLGQKMTTNIYSCSYECFPAVPQYAGSRDSSVGIAMGMPGRLGFVSHSVQTGSGAHPASYPMGTWG